ncbi:MAG: Na+/H+ antiporter NhaA [Thermoanaerobaculia bacterium]|nr:Na+/H+ antiporter NhaA [Thermoanaerobaculia bacterium]
MLKRQTERLLTPIQEFMRTEAASGVILGLAAILALIIANSPLRPSYEHLLHLPISFGIGTFDIEKGLSHWINDGLMAIFFLLVGLEIKRELKLGELSDPKSAALPIVAAAGGAVVPAIIYLAFCHGTGMAKGWAIPMATDIAFALGVVALLGSRIPPWGKVFLMALAVVDDLIAVLVIAFFYTSSLNVTALLWAALFLVILITMNLLGVRRLGLYLAAGFGLWAATLGSGVHATVAGVVLGLTIPAVRRNDQDETLEDALEDAIEAQEVEDGSELEQARLNKITSMIVHESPLHRLEHLLHPIVAFGIMPVFAFANAGVAIDTSVVGDALRSPMAPGIILGLFFGKQIGIVLSFVILAKLGFASQPLNKANLRLIHGLSLVAGIGFTMSLFVAGLSFVEGPLFEEAKLSILAASAISGAVGYVMLRRMKPAE